MIYLILILIILLFVPFNWSGSKIKYRLIDTLNNFFIKFSHISGFRPLNTKVCEENLLLLNEILTKADIPFWLSEGTALGVVRDSKIIPWDDDLDISFMYNYREKFLELLPILEQNGFVLSLVLNNGNFLGFIKNNEKVDIDIVQKDGSCNAAKTKNAGYTSKCNDILPYLNRMRKITFLGKEFNVPGDDYFEFLYGSDWKTPKRSK